MHSDAVEKHPPLEGVVCPSCLLTNSPAAAFCSECGAPIGIASSIDPIQRIQAEGFALRQAAYGPPKLIIVLGVWLLAGSILIAQSVVLYFAQNWLEMVVSGVIALVLLVILFRVTVNYIVKSRAAHLMESSDQPD